MSTPYSSTLEIIEVSDTIDLTVLATAKEELGIAAEDTSQDAKLTRWIHEVSGQICAYCDRILGRETVKQTFTMGWYGYLGPLTLTRRPVAYIDSISAGEQLLTTADYRYAPTSGLLYRNYGRWVGDVVVQYQAGYQLLGELPYDLERACLLLLQYRQTTPRDQSIRAESVPGVYSVDYWVGTVPGSSNSMPADVISLLTPYRDVAI